MSPDRVGVMFWGSHRQVCSPPRWAEPSVLSGGCTVIKNDSVSRTCERFAHRKPSVVKTAAASRFPLKIQTQEMNSPVLSNTYWLEGSC